MSRDRRDNRSGRGSVKECLFDKRERLAEEACYEDLTRFPIETRSCMPGASLPLAALRVALAVDLIQSNLASFDVTPTAPPRNIRPLPHLHSVARVSLVTDPTMFVEFLHRQ